MWLMAKGYRILAHRARTPFGDVDLAAQKGRTPAIKKVKARATRLAALESASLRQRERTRGQGCRWRNARGSTALRCGSIW